MDAEAVLDLNMHDPNDLTNALGGPADIAECVGKPGLLDGAIDLLRQQGTVLCMRMCMQSEPFLTARGVSKEVGLFFPPAQSVEEFIETAQAFH